MGKLNACFISTLVCLVMVSCTERIGYLLTEDKRLTESDKFKDILSNFSSSTLINSSYEAVIIDARVQLASGKGLYPWLDEKLKNNSVKALIGSYRKEAVEATRTPYFVITDGWTTAESICGTFPGSGSAVSVIPTLEVGVHAMAGFMEFPTPRCKEFIVIVENPDDIVEFLKAWRIMRKQLAVPCTVEFPVVLPMINDSLRASAKQLLSNVRTTGVRYVVIYSNDVSFIKKVVMLAGLELDMVNQFYKWLITYMVIGAIPSDLMQYIRESGGVVNILNMQKNVDVFGQYGVNVPTPYLLYRETVLMDTLLVINRAVQRNISIEDMLSNKVDVLRDLDGVTGNLEHFNGGCRTSFPLQMHIVQNGKPLQMVASATISNSTGFSKSDLGYKVTQVMPLFRKDKIVKIAVPDISPLIIRKNGIISGVLNDLLMVYSKQLGEFRFELVPMKGHHLHQAMVAALSTGVVDAIVGSGLENSPQDGAIDCTEPIIVAETGVLYTGSKKQRVVDSMIIFLKPYTLYAFVVIGCSCLVTAVLLTLITYFDPTTDTIYPTDTIYAVLAMMTLGSADKVASSIPARILMAFFLYFSFIILTSYLANLCVIFISSEALKEAKPPTLSKLATEGGLQYGVVRESEVFRNLEKSSSFPETHIWATISREQKTSVLSTYKDGLHRVLSKNSFVMIGESFILQYLSMEKCELRVENVKSAGIRYSIGFGKGLPYVQQFNKAIGKTRASGESAVILAKYSQRNCIDSLDTSDQLHPRQMLSIFAIFLAGMLISFLYALLNCIITKYRRGKTWKKYTK